MTNKALTYYRPEEVVDNELYSTVITEVEVTMDMFHSIWPGYAPKKELADQIAKACGVSFSNSVRFEDVYGDVSIVEGHELKKKAGVRCTMQGYKMNIDGTMQTSPPLSYEFNWESRAEEDFLNDELSIGTTVNNRPYKPKYYIEDNEIRTDLLRRKHIVELQRFPTQRAGTGASLVIIKFLTGIPSSFKEPDLKKAGMKLAFSQVIKSQKLQAAEAHARVENIRNGGSVADNINKNAGLLTGETVNSSEDFNNHFERVEDQDGVKPESSNKIAPDKPTPPPEKQEFTSEPKTLKEKYESLLETSGADQGTREYFDGIIKERGGTDEILTWAIENLTN